MYTFGPKVYIIYGSIEQGVSHVRSHM